VVTAVPAGDEKPLGVGGENKVNVGAWHWAYSEGDRVNVSVIVALLRDFNEEVGYIIEEDEVRLGYD
jgi:hypothetical protein